MSDRDEKLQKIADEVQDRLSGIKKDPNLHADESDKDERIRLLEGEVKGLNEKFNEMEKTWRKLAKETVGKQETDKMSKGL